jgi:hypothetical protein
VVKRSLLTEAHGIPLAVVIEGANRHDMKRVAPTLAELPLHRPMPTSAQPQGLCLDKGYDYDEVRASGHRGGEGPIDQGDGGSRAFHPQPVAGVWHHRFGDIAGGVASTGIGRRCCAKTSLSVASWAAMAVNGRTPRASHRTAHTASHSPC